MTAQGAGSRLGQAVAEGVWELVALAVLLGAVRLLHRLPPDALPALLDLAGGGPGDADARG